MSRILILGGTGFIGRHVAGRLRAQGHDVLAPSRAALDIASVDDAGLRAALAGADVVVNCAGLVRDAGANTMEAVHAEGAKRLFDACVEARVKRLIHVSALGVSASGATQYQRSKAAAEDYFAARDPGGAQIDWRVLRPSVVIGRGGASTTWLLAAAALPILPRIGGADWRFQPVHIDDLTELVARIADGAATARSVDVVGPAPMTVFETTLALRDWLGLKPAPSFPVPGSLLRLAAAIGGRLAAGPLNAETLKMLQAGNVADAAPMTSALGRPPSDLKTALALHPASEADRVAARLFFLRPLLRTAIAILWIATGLLSFGLYPVEKSYEMLAAIGLTGVSASVALYGGAAADLALGVLLFIGWRPVLVGLLQLASMAVFTLIATGLGGEYWLHPFAPILKNLPIAAAILVMIALEAQ